MFYLSSKLKSTSKMKLNVFHSDLLKKTRQKLKYFLEFETKIDFIAQVKRFENVDRKKKTKFKKRKKKKSLTMKTTIKTKTKEIKAMTKEIIKIELTKRISIIYQ